MWLLGEAASQLLYVDRLTHNQIVAKAGISMFELTRALTIRATYRTQSDIPEGNQ